MNKIDIDSATGYRFKKHRQILTDSLFLNQLLNVYENRNLIDDTYNKEEPQTKRSYKKREK